MFFYTYVLFSFKDKKLYIGYTNNLKRRLKEHSQGKNVRGSAHGIQYLNKNYEGYVGEVKKLARVVEVEINSMNYDNYNPYRLQ